jgi:hypothetical protein
MGGAYSHCAWPVNAVNILKNNPRFDGGADEPHASRGVFGSSMERIQIGRVDQMMPAARVGCRYDGVPPVDNLASK